MDRSHVISRVFRKITILAIVAVIFLVVMSLTAFRPDSLGVSNGRLAPLPDSPNCVSSQTEDSNRKMAALQIDDPRPLEKLKSVIAEQFPRAALITSEDNYLHYEFSSLLFRFVDDVELFADGQTVHFRSASRVGYSDMGANRKRIQRIRSLVE